MIDAGEARRREAQAGRAMRADIGAALAALLVSGEPVGAIVAALFFAALQTGGFAMQRETSVPRVLTLVCRRS